MSKGIKYYIFFIIIIILNICYFEKSIRMNKIKKNECKQVEKSEYFIPREKVRTKFKIIKIVGTNNEDSEYSDIVINHYKDKNNYMVKIKNYYLEFMYEGSKLVRENQYYAADFIFDEKIEKIKKGDIGDLFRKTELLGLNIIDESRYPKFIDELCGNINC